MTQIITKNKRIEGLRTTISIGVMILFVVFFTNFVSAGITVTLNSPANAGSIYTTLVTTNASGVITGGNSLVNATLWDNSSGTWGARNTTTVSSTENDSVDDMWTTQSTTQNAGHKITANADAVIVSVTKPAETTGTNCSVLYSGNSSVIASATYVGNVATFSTPIAIKSGSSYYVVSHSNGGANTQTYRANSHPIARTILTFEGYIYNTGALTDSYNLQDTNSGQLISIQLGETSKTVTNNNTYTNLTIWNYRFCDNTGVCGFAASNYSFNLPYYQTNEYYIVTTTTGATNPFNISFTTNGTVINVAYFNYNGTNYLGSISSTGNNYVLSRNQVTPIVTSSQNMSFYWNFTLSDGTYYATASKNQTVNAINITSNCAGSSIIYNFTLADEVTQELLNQTTFNSSIKVDLYVYSSNRVTQVAHYYNYYNKVNPAAICINTSLAGGEQYSLDMQVQYSSTNHSTEYYNVERYVLNSSTLNQNVTLYDLDSSRSQNFKLIVRDSSYLPITFALVQVERKYLENGTFYITEIPKTDVKGIASASLETEDVIYNFKIYQNGSLVSSFTDVMAICQTPLVSTCEIDFNAFQTSIPIPNYEEGEDFNFTIDYNKTSRVVSSQFVIPSGNPSLVSLNVTMEDSLGTQVCVNSVTSASGTLTCTVPNSFGNATIMAKLYKDGVEMGKGSIKLDQTAKDTFGVIWIVLSVLVMMTLIGIGISDSPIVTAVFLFVGVAILFGINLVNNTGFIGATATILFFAIAIILVIIKAARRS